MEAIADAAEVRGAYLLGSEQPERAKLSAQKSILIGVTTAFIIAAFLIATNESLPTWLTSDETLQVSLSRYIILGLC